MRSESPTIRPDGPRSSRRSFFSSLARLGTAALLSAAAMALAPAGCGSPDIEYPENPTPPPQGDPESTAVEQPARKG